MRKMVAGVAVLFFSLLALAGLKTEGSQTASKEEAPRTRQVYEKAKAASPGHSVVKTVAPSLHTVRVEIPSQRLIAALIRKESKGKDKAIGDRYYRDRNGRLREYPKSHWAYGPLQIREICVADVNSRYGTDYKASDCLGNRELSVRICQRYIAMYATQERLGRPATEEDMARIWNGGLYGWKRPSTVGYWADVRKFL